MDFDLTIPAHLRRAKGDTPMPRPLRWRKMKAVRPEGEKWTDAERWEITIPAGGSMNWTTSGLASGTRFVWVLIGRKWVELRDHEAYGRVPRTEWDTLLSLCGGRHHA